MKTITKQISGLYFRVRGLVEKLTFLPLLLVRLVLAYGFYTPAMMKWKDINAIAGWFGEQLHLPFPLLNAYLAASTEAAGVVLLTLGLGTRIISIPLMVTMFVAIRTVHWGNGFEAANNGFEIPLYYLLMLFILLVSGPGKISLDHLIESKFKKSES
jgi:putative oxidoreductase